MPQLKPRLNQADIQLLKTIFLTKQAAQNLLTKADAKNVAAKNDLKNAIDRATNSLFRYIDERCATKEETARLWEAIKNLPTKEEFFSRMDKLSHEYETFTQEKTVLMHQFEELTRKLSTTVN